MKRKRGRVDGATEKKEGGGGVKKEKKIVREVDPAPLGRGRRVEGSLTNQPGSR